jgi:hypothetical protein
MPPPTPPINLNRKQTGIHVTCDRGHRALTASVDLEDVERRKGPIANTRQSDHPGILTDHPEPLQVENRLDGFIPTSLIRKPSCRRNVSLNPMHIDGSTGNHLSPGTGPIKYHSTSDKFNGSCFEADRPKSSRTPSNQSYNLNFCEMSRCPHARGRKELPGVRTGGNGGFGGQEIPYFM